MLLKSLVNAYRYTYPEIAARLQRTEGSVKRRLMELKIKARPVRIGNHTKYTLQEVKQIVDLYDRGYSIDVIAEIREKCIRCSWKDGKNGVSV